MTWRRRTPPCGALCSRLWARGGALTEPYPPRARRHLLSPADFYVRFNPTLTDSYALDDSRESTLAELTRTAEAYMDEHKALLSALVSRLTLPN